VPLFSDTIKSYYLFKLFLSLSIIVKSKYQFQTAMENSKNIVSNKYMKNTLDTITTQIKQGSSIAQSFKQSSLFDDFTIKLLYVAQHTSSYDKILEELTLYYKEKFKKRILDFSSVVEPLLVLIISLIVLWLILAIMLPIWQMSSVVD
jgi:general secretion pathway protein F